MTEEIYSYHDGAFLRQLKIVLAFATGPLTAIHQRSWPGAGRGSFRTECSAALRESWKGGTPLPAWNLVFAAAPRNFESFAQAGQRRPQLSGASLVGAAWWRRPVIRNKKQFCQFCEIRVALLVYWNRLSTAGLRGPRSHRGPLTLVVDS